MTRRRLSVIIATAAVVALPLAATPAQAAPTVRSLGENLTIPWALAVLPDGSTLMTERDSRNIYRVVPGRARTLVATITEARPQGEGGLLGIVAAPDFARTKQYFIYYTSATDNRVARMTYGSRARPVPIVTGIPKGGNHNGGALVFDLGNRLIIGTGDSGNKALPQNLNSLGGKILRVTRTGAAVPGNIRGKVLAYGLRNVQGLTVARDRRVYANDIGENRFDEVNHISPKVNYGWPIAEGLSSDRRFRNPIKVWEPKDAVPSGLTHINSTLYVGGLRGTRLWRLDTKDGLVTRSTALLVGQVGRIRAVANRGGGVLQITTSNGGGTDKVLEVKGAY